MSNKTEEASENIYTVPIDDQRAMTLAYIVWDIFYYLEGAVTKIRLRDSLIEALKEQGVRLYPGWYVGVFGEKKISLMRIGENNTVLANDVYDDMESACKRVGVSIEDAPGTDQADWLHGAKHLLMWLIFDVAFIPPDAVVYAPLLLGGDKDETNG